MPEMPRPTHSNLLADESCDAYRQDTIHEVPGMREVELAEKSSRQGRCGDVAFEKLDIVRITGVYYAPNAASGRVLEKVGFEYEGTRKNGVAKGD